MNSGTQDVAAELPRPFLDHRIDYRIGAERLDGSQMVLRIVGIDHQLLILLLQNIIVGFFCLEPLIFAPNAKMLALCVDLMLVCDKQQHS